MEFLHYIASDFGLKADAGQSKSSLLIELSKYVTSRGLQGLTTVLIVDEAHNLSMELLEEIRLLSNLRRTTISFFKSYLWDSLNLI